MARISKEKKKTTNKKRVNKSKSEEKNQIELQNDLFSFDNEMVIGVTKKQENKE